eukprot:m.119862 g.119862  ORF g.119862 m.119862 type:complete len:343 (+) comp9264_c0_seq1:7-1035(+)
MAMLRCMSAGGRALQPPRITTLPAIAVRGSVLTDWKGSITTVLLSPFRREVVAGIRWGCVHTGARGATSAAAYFRTPLPPPPPSPPRRPRAWPGARPAARRSRRCTRRATRRSAPATTRAVPRAARSTARLICTGTARRVHLCAPSSRPQTSTQLSSTRRGHVRAGLSWTSPRSSPTAPRYALARRWHGPDCRLARIALFSAASVKTSAGPGRRAGTMATSARASPPSTRACAGRARSAACTAVGRCASRRWPPTATRTCSPCASAPGRRMRIAAPLGPRPSRMAAPAPSRACRRSPPRLHSPPRAKPQQSMKRPSTGRSRTQSLHTPPRKPRGPFAATSSA